MTGGVDEVFQRTDSAGTRAVLTDALGSAVALVDGSGALQTQYTYEPFGATSMSGAASANPGQFTGRENDANGVYFYRARYYLPTLQRFASEDPSGFSAGVNLYAYALDAPPKYRDPTGLDIWIEGPSGAEPQGHLSINVGDPSGNYDSYSFGLDGWTGAVYRDSSHQGAFEPNAYLQTTRLEDLAAKAFLDDQVGKRGFYGPGRTCRDFSRKTFDRFKNAGFGRPVPIPNRFVAPTNPSSRVPISSTSTQK